MSDVGLPHLASEAGPEEDACWVPKRIAPAQYNELVQLLLPCRLRFDTTRAQLRFLIHSLTRVGRRGRREVQCCTAW